MQRTERSSSLAAMLVSLALVGLGACSGDGTPGPESVDLPDGDDFVVDDSAPVPGDGSDPLLGLTREELAEVVDGF